MHPFRLLHLLVLFNILTNLVVGRGITDQIPPIVVGLRPVAAPLTLDFTEFLTTGRLFKRFDGCSAPDGVACPGISNRIAFTNNPVSTHLCCEGGLACCEQSEICVPSDVICCGSGYCLGDQICCGQSCCPANTQCDVCGIGKCCPIN